MKKGAKREKGEEMMLLIVDLEITIIENKSMLNYPLPLMDDAT